jgi:cytochrome c oxidase assembly factor 4
MPIRGGWDFTIIGLRKEITMTKQVLVVRKDLNMSSGKIAAQSVHATLRAIVVSEYTFSQMNVCITCGVKNEGKLFNLIKKAEENNIPYGLQIDSGKTEVESGTATVLSLGPVEGEKIEILNNITKR